MLADTSGIALLRRHRELLRREWVDRLKAAVAGLIDEGVFSDVAEEGIVGRCERGFAEYVGAPHALSFSSGTTALFAAYFAVGVGPGDEVIHPCYSWISAIAPVHFLGARPVFCASGKTFCTSPLP